MTAYKLELHPEKTKIVYCKDEARRGKYPNYKFDCLGFEFRPRWVRNNRRGAYLHDSGTRIPILTK